MAVSTEKTVRDVIVAAIRGVAGDLGFAEPAGNVKDYPLEMHQVEKIPGYLKAKVGNEVVQRAWAVDVRGFDEPFALGRVAKRTYAVTITGYYEKGVDGENYKALVDGARVIRGALNALSPSFGGTVTQILSAGGLDIRELETSAGRLLVGVMTYSALRTNPDFTA